VNVGHIGKRLDSLVPEYRSEFLRRVFEALGIENIEKVIS